MSIFIIDMGKKKHARVFRISQSVCVRQDAEVERHLCKLFHGRIA